MKRLFLLILIILVGCVDKNIIQVNRTQDGFRSELIVKIDREDASDMDFYFCEYDAMCVTRWYEKNNSSNTKKIDLKTKKVEDYEENPFQPEESIWYENEDYRIIYKRDKRMNNEMTQTITYQQYYYEENGKRTLLYEGVSANSDQRYSNVNATMHPIYKEYVFMIKEENKISIKKIDERKLIEIDTIPLLYKQAELFDYYYTSNGYIYRYDLDDEIYLIQQVKENIYKKKLEDGSILVDAYVESNDIVLNYESEEMIRFIFLNNDKEIAIPKKIDDYRLKEYRYGEQNIYTYEGKKGIRIVIDDETYDLGNASEYHLSSDSILFTRRNVELNEYQTFLIDLASNQQYALSETIDMSEISYIDNYYIVRGYGNDELYSILKFDGLSCRVIELPFTWEFMPYTTFDNKIIFVQETQEFISIYYLEIED